MIERTPEELRQQHQWIETHFRHLGTGPGATSDSGEFDGWWMRPSPYFRCVTCDYMMRGDDSYDHCYCGALHKELGRFGSSLGDDRIEVYEIRSLFWRWVKARWPNGRR